MFREADRRGQDARRGYDFERDECVLREDVSSVLARILRYDNVEKVRYIHDELISEMAESNRSGEKEDETLRI